MSSCIHTETSAELFQELVTEAVDHQNLQPSPASVSYLIDLLDGFLRPESLYRHADPVAGRVAPDRPLAEIFCTAVSSEGMRRFSLLKLSGDIALFISGFFSDSLKGGAVDVDYYSKLGGCAYATVAGSCVSREGAPLFEELAASFVDFTDVLSEVSETCGLTEGNDALRLHEKWTRSGSRRCAETLGGLGVPLGGWSTEVH